MADLTLEIHRSTESVLSGQRGTEEDSARLNITTGLCKGRRVVLDRTQKCLVLSLLRPPRTCSRNTGLGRLSCQAQNHFIVARQDRP
ncbi:hypothetical protein H4Q26_015249 [Puccinia striiformis f. sp. tritici PST-130]|nr:hypothetical protein H4Q26_015249 [Puccinia striiformis f. sp. tritici PST-130]